MTDQHPFGGAPTPATPPPPSYLPPPPPPPPPTLGGSIYASPPGWTQAVGSSPGASYAGFGSRLGAMILDGLFGLLAVIPAGIVTGILIGTAPRQDYRSTDSLGNETTTRGPAIGFILLGVFIVLAALIAFAVWNNVIRQGRTGQTLGKRVVGIRVVGSKDGKPIGAGRALGRSLFAWMISGQICYLGYLWSIWDPQHQTWHDKVVDSVVISG